MAITDLGPIVTHEGAGMSRQGTTSVSKTRRLKPRRPKVRRLKTKRIALTRGRGRTSHDSENNPNVAGYHTAAVDAPNGYQGLFGPK
jgi:hypothetical protein